MLFFILSVTGFFSASSYADAEMAKAVIDKAIEGGFSELEKQIIEKYFKSTKNETRNTDSKSKKKNTNYHQAWQNNWGETEPYLPDWLNVIYLPTLVPNFLTRLRVLKEPLVDNAVMLVEKATGRIVDIIKDVVTRS